jgi:sugar phosphate isomerase/epimerase
MEVSMHRRDFLQNSLTAGLVSFLPFSNTNKSEFPTEPRARLAVSSYPFRTLIRSAARDADGMNQADMTLEEFAAVIPRRFEVTGIEPWSRHFQSTDPAYVSRLAAGFQKAGVHVVNIPVDLTLAVCDTDPQKRGAGLDQYHKWIDAAVILKSPSIRVHVPAKAGGQADIQCAVDALRSLAGYGESRKIVVNLENDNPHTEDPFTIVELLKTANTQYLRALPDFCNSMLIGDDPAYNRRGLQAMFRYAYNISHVKDSENDRGKLYTVDVGEIFEIAKRARYRGYFSMEWEGEGDPYAGTMDLLRKTVNALAG